MKNTLKKAALLLGSISLLALAPAHGQVITQWTFGTTVAAPDNSPAPTTGSGTAVSLGMTNTYTYAGTTATNSVTSDDIVSSPGVANPSFVENTWRIRGAYQATGTAPNSGKPANSANVNGWNLSAPQYTQGVEFDVSTVGYSNISVSFDWYDTTQGIRDLQEQYTLNGTTWTNINPLQVAVPNDFDGTSSPTNTINFASIAGANDNANFGIRLVSAYDPTYTGAGAPTYTSDGGTNGAVIQYNNNSGNWRFGDVTFDGTADAAVPEPATWLLLPGGLISLVLILRRRAGALL
jgi:hypothetical protein